MLSDLFTLPFLTGLALAILLPVLGCYLRLRNEWLAALAASHVAAAGALLASLLGGVASLGGVLAAALLGASKPFVLDRLKGGAAYPLLFIAAWSASVLLVANHPLAERLGQALFDGQLYFAGGAQLALVGVWTLGALIGLRRLSSRLLLAHFYPDHFRLRGLPQWPIHLGFDLLAALTVAIATMSLGVMGSFALLFVPAWLAFQRAADWRCGLRLAVVLGVVAYVLAFAIALTFDQPFGPVLAALVVGLGLCLSAMRPR